MAYNNGFPVSYQQQFYPQQYQIPVQQPAAPQSQPRSNPMIWVQGETGAKSYLMEPPCKQLKREGALVSVPSLLFIA